jgi:RibD C-terminal domain
MVEVGGTSQERPRRSPGSSTVRRADAHQAVADLKSQPGRDILMFGSITLWNDLLTAGLVVELHLMLGATVLGGGTSAFATAQLPLLRLLTTERRDSSTTSCSATRSRNEARWVPRVARPRSTGTVAPLAGFDDLRHLALCRDLPPQELITSALAVVLVAGGVLVVRAIPWGPCSAGRPPPGR